MTAVGASVVRWTRRGARDAGAATLLALSIVAVVLTLATGALMVGSVVIASHRARLAADLGALAGATAAQHRPDASSACAAASRVAQANGAATQTCSVDGADVELTVAVSASLWPAPATARSRAGPER
ncbi:Rv3654c family TadE-like protein [Terrabacter sp. 2RAF25]|uniref:Rv3654c family TadE-like protein n=1 Tax=Terrabacter sp. 2RAF25 TaxID=3232998 RepID=UPI003F9D07A6